MKYLSFTNQVDELDHLLNKYGKDGWRLVSCSTTPSYGPNGTGIPNATVIMEKLEHTVEEDTAEEEPAAEAMPMRG